MFVTKPAEWEEGLDSIAEECEKLAFAQADSSSPSASSESLTLSDVASMVQRRQSTLDLFSLQTPDEESQFHKARAQRLDHIARELRAKDGGVEVTHRLRGLRQYDACFVGREAVDWLVAHRYAQTRVEAVMVGNDLMDAGHFHHVADKTDYVERRYKYAFKDSSDDFYRFYVHEVEQPNQIQKRLERREKMRQKHRRTRSEVTNLRDSDPLLSPLPRLDGAASTAAHSPTPRAGSGVQGRSRCDSLDMSGLPGLSEPASPRLKTGNSGSGVGLRKSGGGSGLRRRMKSSDGHSTGAEAGEGGPAAEGDNPDAHSSHSKRGNATTSHSHLRTSGGADVPPSSPSASPDDPLGAKGSGSLPSRVKSKVRQVMGEKLRPEWVEVTYPATEEQTPNDVEALVWGYQKVDDTPPDVMLALASVNTLHRGCLERATGSIVMIGLDGTEASRRAFQMLISHILKPCDYVYLVAIRERKLPDKLALHSRNSEERLKWQFDLWRVARKILRPAHKELVARQIEHSALSPKASDARRKLVHLARQYHVQTIILGKHGKADSNPLSAVQGHFRKMTSFASKHAKWADVLIF